MLYANSSEFRLLFSIRENKKLFSFQLLSVSEYCQDDMF